MPAPSASRHRAGRPPNPSPVELRARLPAAEMFSARPRRFLLTASPGWLPRAPWTPAPSAWQHRDAPPRDPSPAALPALVPAAKTLSARQHPFPPDPSLDELPRSPWTPTPPASRHPDAPPQDPFRAALPALVLAAKTLPARQHPFAPAPSPDELPRSRWTPVPSVS